ncbi:hypothetical protein AMJ57_03595 [Parcubacteria bacterium SG8_24]|nr:MAG: hypothetical protein AMJ57_03595 [Parcubacteria bacterium SG8_24]
MMDYLSPCCHAHVKISGQNSCLTGRCAKCQKEVRLDDRAVRTRRLTPRRSEKPKEERVIVPLGAVPCT